MRQTGIGTGLKRHQEVRTSRTSGIERRPRSSLMIATRCENTMNTMNESSDPRRRPRKPWLVHWQRSFVTGLLLEFPLLLWRRGPGRGGRLYRNFCVAILVPSCALILMACFLAQTGCAQDAKDNEKKATSGSSDLVPLELKLPSPAFKGTP